ncbi:MAG: hypothetical protein U9Q96_01660 [Patescibacteria group bacterium]|nr:hypothetical protein [Patescibacteria group bacterium]
MLYLGFGQNSKQELLEKEKNYCEKEYKNRRKNISSPFSFGEDFLFGKESADPIKSLSEFSSAWLDDPSSYLDLKKYSLSKISKKNDLFCFSSILNKEDDQANFYTSFYPKARTNKKVVAIVVPHWNAKRSRYLLGTNIVRNLLLPLSTAIYFPSYEQDNEIEYDMVGPNIGLSLYRFWQDILNLKHFANYLKNDLGFDKVGLVSFSLGSPRALMATIFLDIEIDFLLMNFLADDHTEAVMKGAWTREIAEIIEPHIEYEELKKIWMPMSPGAYTEYFNKLPKATCLTQGKYDLIFGLENARKIMRKFRQNAPFVNIEEGMFGHVTIAQFEKSIPLMIRNARFIRKNTELKLI